MLGPADAYQTERKRLLWRATHRGIKEMDIVIGGFAHENLPSMSQNELSEFGLLLDTPDQELLAWLTGQSTVPAASSSPLLHKMLSFRPKPEAKA